MKARWSCVEFSAKHYHDPPLAPLIDFDELSSWSFHRAIIAEFITTLLFLYITVLTNIGYKSQIDPAHGGDQCGSVGILAWASGGMISILVYCTAAIAGGHIKPAVTFGLFLGRKVSLIRAAMYMVAQCLGAICGVGLVKAFQKTYYNQYGGKGNELAPGYNKGVGMGGAEIIGTFVLVYTVFSATDPERSARDSHVPVLFWLHFPLDLLFPWFTLPPSPLLELASTLLGALELLSSTTKTSPGMTIEFSGLDHSLELPLLHSTTSTF